MHSLRLLPCIALAMAPAQGCFGGDHLCTLDADCPTGSRCAPHGACEVVDAPEASSSDESGGAASDTSSAAVDPTSSTTETSHAGGSESSSTDDGNGPDVDLSDPQLYAFEFTPDEADPLATLHIGVQLAYLDTRVSPVGRLVVQMHGPGAPATCGSRDHGQALAGMGFHVVSPCYVADYGVDDNCGDDVGGCRLEAFEGIDHHPLIEILPPDSTETRVTRMLEHLQDLHPGGDWQYFVSGGSPRWESIVISGISHGATSAALVGFNRLVDRVVMLSGPCTRTPCLDTGRQWLAGDPVTPVERFWGFTHSGDEQHAAHLVGFEDLQLAGTPASVDATDRPYGGSHRLISSLPSASPHGATQAGTFSPMDDRDTWTFSPVWRLMYGADE